MAFNSYVILSAAKNLADGWQPRPPVFLRKQEQGWGCLSDLYVKRDIQIRWFNNFSERRNR